MIYQAKTKVGLDVTSSHKVVIRINDSEVELDPRLALDLSARIGDLANAASHGWGTNRPSQSDSLPRRRPNPEE